MNNRWAVSGIVLCLAAFLWSREVIANPTLWLLVFGLLQLGALVCGIMAAIRGSRWWLLIPAWSVLACFIFVFGIVGD